MKWLKSAAVKMAAWAARILPMPVKSWFYKTPMLARIIRRSLNAAAPDGMTEIQVAGGILAGAHLMLDLHSEKDYWLGTYEPDLQDAAQAFIQPGMVVYDVGANIGYITLMAARLVGAEGQVVSFEALPANIDRLKTNLAANPWVAHVVRVIHAAVLDKEGEAVFLVHQSGAMGKAEGSAGRVADYSQRITVPALSLDHFMGRAGSPAPHVVKMDIEGGEGLALAGMVRILGQSRPVLLIELHGEQAARQVWDLLSVNGYSLHRMRRGYERVQDVQELDWKSYVIGLPPGTHR